MYEVWRRTGTDEKFVFIGSSGVRSFIDDTLAAGSVGPAGVSYRITAVRSTRRGTPATFTVLVGGAGGTGSAPPISFIPLRTGRRREEARASASMAA